MFNVLTTPGQTTQTSTSGPQYKMAVGLGGQVETKVPLTIVTTTMKKKKRKLIVLPSLPVKKQAYAAAAGNALLEQQYKVAASEIAPVLASVIDSYGGVAAIGTVNLDPALQAVLEKIPEGCSKKLKKIVDLYPDYLVSLPEARFATALGYENGTVSADNIVDKDKMQRNHREKKMRDVAMNMYKRPKRRGIPRLLEARDYFYKICMELDARAFEAGIAEIRQARAEIFVGGVEPPGYPYRANIHPPMAGNAHGLGATSKAIPLGYPYSKAPMRAPPPKVVPLRPGMSTAKVKVKQITKKKKKNCEPEINMKKIDRKAAVPHFHGSRSSSHFLGQSKLLEIKPERPQPSGTTSLPFLQHVRCFLGDKKLAPGEKVSMRVIMSDAESNRLHSKILADQKKPMLSLLEEYPEHFKVMRQGTDACVSLTATGAKKPLMLKV